MTACAPSEPHGQYFKEQVRLELVERFGWDRVHLEGLRVFTTLDMPMQVAAEAATAGSLKSLDDQLQALAARRAATRKTPPVGDSGPLQAALVAMEPGTGYVRALVGGRDFNASRFNRAVQARRQPGSAFKPFVYAAALEAGYTPASVIDRLNDPIATLEGAWVPADGHSTEDDDDVAHRSPHVQQPRGRSPPQEIGIPSAVQYARTMGVGDVPSVPSLALGSGEVTLTSMTAAYAAFANQGRVPKPIVIRRVEDREGRLLYEAQVTSARAVSETTAFLMSTMMADVINAGTAAGARTLGFKLPAAGKTGTTNDYHDAWFIGYTPKLVTGVWVGFDQPRTILPNGYASDVAVPLWADVHEVGHAERRVRMVQGAERSVDRHRVSNHGQARGRRVRARGGDRQERRGRHPVDGLHRIFRQRQRADRVLPAAFRAWNLRHFCRPFFRETAPASRRGRRRRGEAVRHGRHSRRAWRFCADRRHRAAAARDTRQEARVLVAHPGPREKRQEVA